MRRFFGVTAIIVTLVIGTSLPASAGGSDARSIIKARTGADATQVQSRQTVGSLSVDVGRDKTGKVLESYAQRTKSSVRMMAVVTNRSQRAVDFALTLPTGAEVKAKGDGSLVVFREVVGPDPVIQVFGSIDAPWAVDANGRELATSYTYADGVLTQSIDTAGATFPVVADPTIKGGYYYLVPVVYLKWSWSETNFIQGNLDWVAIAMAYMCSRTGPYAAVCAAYSAALLIDVKTNTDYAVSHGRCFKQRIPVYLGMFWAYDGYTVPC